MPHEIPLPIVQSSISKGSQICALLGATNTGKTYRAIERLLYYGRGIIGLPLRLLAREVYEQLVEKLGVDKVALLTGEERIEPIDTCIWVATVESMPLQHRVPFVVVDEIQLASHPKRGHVFTERILHARGTIETWFLGSDMMRSVLERLTPTVQIYTFRRFSKLIYDGQKPLHRLPKRSAIIAFSTKNLYEIAEAIRRIYGGVSVVLGSLSPKARNAQVQMFESGEVDYIVSTDAIGMGLNLDVRAVYFSSLRKFDGHDYRDLHPWEIGQIAGRAGRYKKDGYFGIIEGSSEKMRDWLIEQVEQQSFSSLGKIYYRNTDLCFDTTEDLCVSLRKKSPIAFLYPSWNLIDERGLHSLLADNHIQKHLTNPKRIELLWQVCKIPDYRQETDSNHVRLLEDVFLTLSEHHVLENDWIEGKMQQIYRKDGNLQQMLLRISNLKTMAYIVHRDGWVEDADHWRSLILHTEEQLSNWLHQRLTQTFVDETTSVGHQFEEPEHVSNEDTEIFCSRGKLGHITNWSFVVESHALRIFGSANARRSSRTIAATLYNQYIQQPPQICLQNRYIQYFSQGIAKLEKGYALLQPKILILAMDLLSETQRRYLYEKVQEWFADELHNFFDLMLPLPKNKQSPAVQKLHTMLQYHLGVVPRESIFETWKQLTKQEKQFLFKNNIYLGRTHLISKNAFKNRFVRLRTVLFCVFYDITTIPEIPKHNQCLTISLSKEISQLLGYIFIPKQELYIRVDIYDRIITELQQDRTSQLPCSWLGCKKDVWDEVRNIILKKQNKRYNKQQKRQKNRNKSNISESKSPSSQNKI